MAHFDTTTTLRSLLTLTLLCATSALSAARPESAQILKQMVEHYGGQAALEKLNAPYRQQWDLVAMTSKEKGTDQRTINLPQMLTVELTYQSKSEKRILDGDRGEKIFNKTRHVAVQGPGLMAMKLQRMRLYNPLLLQQRAAEIGVSEESDGYYRLTLREGGLTTDYYVNRQTLLIDKVTGTLTMNGAAMTFLTEYHDYKAVDGVMLPHKEIKFAGSINTAVLTLRETHFES